MLTCDFSVRLGDTLIRPNFIAPSGITVLFGPSGSGKTITMRSIAGLVQPDVGTIRLEESTFFDSSTGISVSPGDRAIGYVPQSLALYPHMTVAENIAFGSRGGAKANEARVRHMLELLDLRALEGRRPRTLSGGQQQRVALARALSREDVRLLLMDEPLSALDETLRGRLRRELLTLRAEVGFDALFITHDIREAFILADWIVIFDEGRVLQDGAREEVFRRPLSRRVGELTGVANLLHAEVVAVEGDEVVVDVQGAHWRAAMPQWVPSVGDTVDLAIRAERIPLRRRLSSLDRPSNLLEATVARDEAYGASHTLTFTPLGPGPTLEVDLPARPYDVLGVAHTRDWLLEVAPADIHLMRVAAHVAPGSGGGPAEP